MLETCQWFSRGSQLVCRVIVGKIWTCSVHREVSSKKFVKEDRRSIAMRHSSAVQRCTARLPGRPPSCVVAAS